MFSDHENVGLDTSFLMVLLLVTEIWSKTLISIMADIKMAAILKIAAILDFILVCCKSRSVWSYKLHLMYV